MYKKRIEIFENENPGESFPDFETLYPGVAESIRLKILRRVGLNQSTSPGELIDKLYTMYNWLKGFSADSEKFDLSTVFEKIQIQPEEYIYINWYRFDHIDKMKFIDLCKYLEYIWYAGPDDIEIFDNTLKWMIAINHSGGIGFINLKLRENKTDL